MEAHDRLYIEQKNFDERTIAIDTLGVGTTEFDLSKQPQRVRKLYESGRAAAEAFLEDFDYEEHLRGPEGRGKGVEIRPNWRLPHAYNTVLNGSIDEARSPTYIDNRVWTHSGFITVCCSAAGRK